MSNISYCIVGGGAIGGLLAFFLYRAGINDLIVYYKSWDSVREVESNGGITVVTGGKEYLVPVKPRHYTRPHGKCDIILCAVKAYDVEGCIGLIKSLAHDDSLIVSLQNGFGSYELLAETFGYYNVAIGVVNIGSYRVCRSKVVESGIGEIIFGQKNAKNNLLEVLASTLKIGGCPTRITEYIDKYRWLKLAVNAVINPLTAITMSRNGVVCESPYLREIAYNVLRELVIAAKLEQNLEFDLDRLFNYVMRIASITRNNYSSMLQDIINGRRTEIDYINGFIVNVLEKYGYDAPVNRIIVNIVRAIESLRSGKRLK